MKKYEILEKYFGYKKFRPLQEEIIDGILESKDVLMILQQVVVNLYVINYHL